MSKLHEIFGAITPENIKNIPVLNAAMEIFIDNLNENSKISADISKIYDCMYDSSDSTIITESKEKLRKALLDVYLSSFYNVLSKAQNSEVIRAKLDSLGITDIPFINDVQRILNDEYFVTNKIFKEKLGTTTSIDYAYNLTKFLESAESGNDMQLYEVKPFHFRTEGSIFKEMYENVVKPLSHPIGFTYTYNQIIKDSLQDLFGVEISYNINTVEMRNLDGRVHVFSTNANADWVKSQYVGNRINEITGKVFTEEEYDTLVTVYLNKVPDVFTDAVVDTRIIRNILFTDGTFLQQKTNPIEITYTTYTNFLYGVYTEIYDYNNSHWSLFVDYDTDYTFQYSDTIDQFVETFAITNIKENNGGDEAQKYYNLTSGEYSFHIGGDSYVFAPGVDEVKFVYNNPNDIISEINDKFNVTIYGKTTIDELVNVTISDIFGSSVQGNYIKPDESGNFSVTLNTYALNGKNYSIDAFVMDGSIKKSCTLSTNGLNDFNNSLGFTEVFDNYEETSNTLKVRGFAPIGRTVELILTDSVGSTVTNTGVAAGNGMWEIILSLALKEAGDYRINATVYKPNGKPEYKSFYESNNLRTRIADIAISVTPFVYTSESPVFAGLNEYTAIPNVNSMLGFNSSNSLIAKQIGELAVDDTFAPADSTLSQYMIANGYSEFNEIPLTAFLSGSYVEGSDYKNVFQSDLDTEETFINYGRKVYPIDTSDFIIITSTDYATEEFLAFGLSTTGYYLYTDEPFGEDYYLDTTDEFYLTTLGD